jgi:GNAT superfamily N-acetyltransferase
MELRATTAEDLPALHRLFLASIASVYRPRRLDPPSPPLHVFAAQQTHVLETGRSVVADEGGRPLGFGAAWTRGSDWFLASLFVAPSAQGRGVGRALLDAVWDGDALRRRTITDAIQPVSNLLYARRGLVPVTPVLTFVGRPVVADRIDPSEASLEEVDAAAYGFDRAVDHVYWARSARRTTWRGAYSYAFPDGTIGPVAGIDAAAAARAFEGELARATGPVSARIPGSARRLVDAAVRAGLRLAPTPGLLLVSEPVRPPDALVLSGYTLA